MIYLDNAATTRMSSRVLDAMTPYMLEEYANPAADYSFAADSRRAVQNAGETIAGFVNALPEEIYFTSGGTESDNIAIKSVAYAYREKGKHIITTQIEHHAVLNACAFLEKEGFEVTYLPVNPDGIVNPDEVREAIRKDTILISVMMANNEIGTIQPIKEIGQIAKENGVLFHTDAVAAFGHIDFDVRDCGIDMFSASAHKFGGPKGVGLLYMRKGIEVEPLFHGGSQQDGKRAGTLNVPGIVGLAEAVKIAYQGMTDWNITESRLRDYLIDSFMTCVSDVKLNGHSSKRLSNNVNLSFKDVNGESLLILLDGKGVCASAGSACNSKENVPSHVLEAIGCGADYINGSIRLTLSHSNTMEEMRLVVDYIIDFVTRLRELR